MRTKAFEEEQKAGRALWAGLHEPILSKKLSERPGRGALEGAFGGIMKLKDTASTDVVVHAESKLSALRACLPHTYSGLN